MSKKLSNIKKILDTAKILAEQKFVCSTEGNISILIKRAGTESSARMLITKSGSRFGELKETDLIECDFDGNYKGYNKPSCEWKMHAGIYAVNPAECVLHVHPVWCTAMVTSGLNLDEDKVGLPFLECLGGHVKSIREFAPGSDELATAVEEVFRNNEVVCSMFSRHGIVCVGKSLQEGLDRVFLLERVAKLQMLLFFTSFISEYRSNL